MILLAAKSGGLDHSSQERHLSGASYCEHCTWKGDQQVVSPPPKVYLWTGGLDYCCSEGIETMLIL